MTVGIQRRCLSPNSFCRWDGVVTSRVAPEECSVIQQLVVNHQDIFVEQVKFPLPGLVFFLHYSRGM